MTDTQANPPRFGAFRLGKRLGGSPGRAVYLAERGGSRPITCALKKLERIDVAPVPLAQFDGFCRQIEVMRRLDHPGIVKTLAHHLPAGHTHGIPGSFVCPACQVGQYDADSPGAPFLVMEHLPGIALDRMARAQARTGQPLAPALGAYIVHEMARAAAYLHGLRDERGRPLGLVHGQLRPRKVMLLRGGEVKLLAYGGHPPGVVPVLDGQAPRGARLPGAYLAPEQLLGKPLDARADLFALGAVLWELLVGVPLFGASSENEAIAKVLTCEVPRPSSLCPQIPSGLDAIVLRAVSRDPARRQASVEEFAEELVRGLPPRAKLLMHTASLVASVREPNTRELSPVPRRQTPRFRRTTPPPPPPLPLPPRRTTPLPALPLPPRRTTPLPAPSHAAPQETTSLAPRERVTTQSPAPTETPSRALSVRLPPPPRKSSLAFHLTRLALVAVVAFAGGVLWHQQRGDDLPGGVASERPEVIPLATVAPAGALVNNPPATDRPLPPPGSAAAAPPAPSLTKAAPARKKPSAVRSRPRGKIRRRTPR